MLFRSALWLIGVGLALIGIANLPLPVARRALALALAGAGLAALRAHLKLLERGVNQARTARVGPEPVPAAIPVQAARPAPRPAPASFQMPRSTTGSDGKPKAKAKSGVDFGSIFGNADSDKRQAS